MTWPPPYIPRLVAISGRTEDAVREAARRYGYERYSTSWQDVVDDPEVQVFDNGGPTTCTPSRRSQLRGRART